jgi:hypothetical protein
MGVLVGFRVGAEAGEVVNGAELGALVSGAQDMGAFVTVASGRGALDAGA